jgi:Rrf2 family transcriptional regulator, nitric oxide-sensitive transcriptional repressor
MACLKDVSEIPISFDLEICNQYASFVSKREKAMRLTRHTDYALRVLLHLGAYPDQPRTIAEIARFHGVSRNHLMKVVQGLGGAGFVASTRGRGGGIRLARPAAEINVGAVVRRTEEDFALADCGPCVFAGACGLRSGLDEALASFMAVLDRYSIADLLVRRPGLAALVGRRGAHAEEAPVVVRSG